MPFVIPKDLFVLEWEYVFRYTENENELGVHALMLSPAAAMVAARAGAPGEPFTKTPTAVAAVS